MKKIFSVALFDLDGVIVDTAKYHYLAWKEMAQILGFNFTLEQNELLKGISRTDAMEVIERLSGKTLSRETKIELSKQKNECYLELIAGLTPADILPGVLDCLYKMREKGVKIGLGSASKNAVTVLEKLEIIHMFDAIIDGTKVEKAKPDPEVFLKGALECEELPENCVVFEDAFTGVAAAKIAGMYAVGVGDPQILGEADIVVSRIDCNEVYELFDISNR